MAVDRPGFQYLSVMRSEATKLQAALAEGRAMLTGKKDIDAAGHHFETAVRDALRRRLPAKYTVGTGHVVDHGWQASAELDVVIADVANGLSFFTGADDTGYYPYEAVFGFGEIKMRYEKKHLYELIAKISDMKNRLRRERTPANYLPGLGPVPFAAGGWPYRNPMFTFAIFGESADFEIEDVAEAFAGQPWDRVPNVMCFLDSGIAALTDVKTEGDEVNLNGIVQIPEFADPGGSYAWTHLPLADPEDRAAASLASLDYAILTNLDRIVLMPAKPDMYHAYLLNAGLLEARGPVGIAAERPSGDRPPEPLIEDPKFEEEAHPG